MIPHVHSLEGMLTILATISLNVVSVGVYEQASGFGSNPDPRLVYDNYYKDYRSLQYYGCSYEGYMHFIIDTLIASAENSVSEADCRVTEADASPSCNEQCYARIHPDEITPVDHNTEYGFHLGQQPNVG